MKKTTIIAIVIVVLAIIAIIVFGSGKSDYTPLPSNSSTTPTVTTPVSVSETVKVSGKLLEYKNDELGFSVKYPNNWSKSEMSNGVAFVMPIDNKSQVSTVSKLEAAINVYSGNCSFPPVTTIKDRGTIKAAGSTLNMISMTNSVQGRNYFDRMYSLQKGDVCYVFAFSSITQSAASQKLTGSNATQAENNNKAIVNTADASFTDVVKSFGFVTGPQGVDETTAAPVKK